MRSAGDFLSRFQKLAPPNDALRRVVSRAVTEVLGTSVPKEKVSIRNMTAYVDVSSVAKHKLRISKRDLLDLIYELMPQAKNLVRDIR